MGMWRKKQDAILKHKSWIILFVSIVFFVELAATYVNHIQNQNIWKSVASLLRNEVNSANSYQIARALSDMEKENWIKCVSLIETTNGSRIFYDTTTQSYCGILSNKTEGNLTSINGSNWILRFSSADNIWFLIIRLVIPLLVGMILQYIFKYIDHQKKVQEAAKLRVLLEKDILLDLAKQTRHDIASPIGALKLVIQRIEVAPEYSEILGSIVERIDGIFSQLKEVGTDSFISVPNVSLEMVSIEKILMGIVHEKIEEWNLDPSVFQLRISPCQVIGNQIELGRVISNILNNSIEAKRKDIPLKITVSTQNHGKYCLVQIVDNGIGMSEEVLCKVGQKGYSFGKDKDSSGIGLYNAEKTIRSFGGDFKIQSEIGSGTTISINLKCE